MRTPPRIGLPPAAVLTRPPARNACPPQSAAPLDPGSPLFNKPWWLFLNSLGGPAPTGGAFSAPYRSFTDQSTTLDATDFTVESINTGPTTAGLPNPGDVTNQIFALKNSPASTSSFTIVPAIPSQLIDNNRFIALLPGETLLIQSDGSAWQILNLGYGAGFQLNFRSFTGTVSTITATDFTVESINTAAAVVNLSDATAGPRSLLCLKNSPASTNNLTATPTGAQTIDGAATLVLAPGQSALIQMDGANWVLLSIIAMAGLNQPFRSFAGAATTLTTADFAVESINTAAAAATLPSAILVPKQVYALKNSAASTNNLAVTPFGAQKIDGAASFLLAPGNAVLVQSDGANWIVLAVYIAAISDDGANIKVLGRTQLHLQNAGAASILLDDTTHVVQLLITAQAGGAFIGTQTNNTISLFFNYGGVQIVLGGADVISVSGNVNVSGVYKVGAVQVLGARRTGWSAATATQSRAALTNTATLVQVTQALAALLADLTATGTIGP